MPAEASQDRRGITINLRADERRRSLIDRAAQAVGKNRSEFMLDAAMREATSVLLDQRFFLLDKKAFKRFTDALGTGYAGMVTAATKLPQFSTGWRSF